MTLQEIRIYLKKHYFLVFRYKSKYYSFKRSRFFFFPKYSLIATDAPSHHRNSLKKLCEQVYISKNTLLTDAIKDIEIPEQDDPSWETYEAIRHSAIVYRAEILFSYRKKSYWIVHSSDGLSYLSDDSGNTQTFHSCYELFANAHIDGCTLADIWKDVIVDSC